MIEVILAILVCMLAALPALMFFQNLQLYTVATKEPEKIEAAQTIGVSVLIPARNEEASIQAALESILATTHKEIEVIVLDDHSEDATYSIVSKIASADARVRIEKSSILPSGWNGKQHACWQLAGFAKHENLLFLDADVRLTPDAISRIVAQQQQNDVPLLSGFPRQETGTFAEKLLIPLMHFVLLGYLPISQMRSSAQASFAAGCGQLFFAKRSVYMAVGGHSAISGSRHDGIKLPRMFRSHGHMTDLFDATDVARCRMYHSFSQVTVGLLKNAHEGIANAKLILPFTILLVGGVVLPLPLLLLSVYRGASWLAPLLLLAATCLSWFPRVAAAIRFRQSWAGVVFHPVSVAWFVTLQWIALVRHQLGLQVQWRGRL